ncbi:MAG: sugar ABC transporter permease [Candidatus Nanopelagicaceae bacterium]
MAARLTLETSPPGTPSVGRAAQPKRPSIPNLSRLKRIITPYLFIAPGVILFSIAIIYPALKALTMSFYDWKIVSGAVSQFVGFDNYIRAYHDPHFWLSLANSGIYMLFTVPFEIAIGLAIALLLKKKSPTQPLFRVLFYLPVVTSWVVVTLLFRYLFADKGLINFTLNDFLHLTDSDVSWLSQRSTALVAICALGIWKGVGWSMMIFLAALQGVPEELEEAATVDGANRWQRFKVVTLPAIAPATTFVTIMLVIGGFNVFASVLLMTNGGPYGQTDVVLTYMYQQAFTFLDFGYGAALSAILALIVFILAVIQLRLFRSRNAEEI